MKVYGSTKKGKKPEVHQLIRALEREGRGEGEEEQLQGEMTVDFTIWRLIRGGLEDEGGNKGGT